jgi:hypothetical protein
MATAEMALQATSMEPTPEQKATTQEPPMLVQIMEGVTFSALLILFSTLYAFVTPVFLGA